MPGAYWSPNDDLEYSRVANGLSQVQSDLTNGELDPADGEPLLEELNQKREAFEARKQAAHVQQIGQQRLQTSDDLAFRQSVQLRHQQQGANDFMTTTAVFKDPEGKLPTKYFYQSKPGEFTPLDAEAAAEPEVPELVKPEDMTGFVEDRVGPPEAPAPQPAPQQSPDPPGTFRQTLYQGGRETVVLRDPAGRVIGLEGDPSGLHGVLGSANRSSGNLDEGLATEAWRRANAAVPGSPSPERFARVQQEFAKQLPMVERQAEERQIGELYGLSGKQIAVAKREASAAIAGMDRKAAQRAYPQILNQMLRTLGASQRQHSAEQIKVQREERKAVEKEKAEQQKQQQLAQRRFDHEYTKNFDQLQREVNAFRAGKTEEEVQKFAADPANAEKSYLWDRDAHKAEAKFRAEGATLDKFPEWGAKPANPSGKDSGSAAGGSAESTPAPAQAQQKAFAELMQSMFQPKPKAMDLATPGQLSEAEIERARRLRMRPAG